MKLAGTIQFSYPILRTTSISTDFNSVYLLYYVTLTTGVLATTTIGLVLSHNFQTFNPLNPELNPTCYLLALLAHHFLHVSRIRDKSLTLRLLMSYIHIYIYIHTYIYIYIYMTLVT
jgi:hypothetical protein